MRVLAWPAYSNRELNPYNYLLYSALTELGATVADARELRLAALVQRYDVLHLHWPEHYLELPPPRFLTRAGAFITTLSALKARGAKVVWTVHNLAPHDPKNTYAQKPFYRLLTGLVDGTIHLSQEALKEARTVPHLRALNHKAHVVIPHGHYRGYYPDNITSEEARRKLKIGRDHQVLLHLGLLRPYKGIERLITAFTKLEDPNMRLVIAGSPADSGFLRTLKSLASADPRIEIHPRFIPNEELQVYFRAADIAVLPYRKVLNSGSALLALSFNVPVLAPALGSIREVAEQVGEGWVNLFQGELSSADILKALAAARRLKGSKPDLSAYEWSRIAASTLDFYKRLRQR